MKRDSKDVYKKCFLILTVVFVGMFVAEFISVLTGNPITEIHISGLDLEQDIIGIKLLRSFISASMVGGILNIFLTVKVIKAARGRDRLPTPVVIVMTLLFPFEILVGGVFVVPNIIFWGIKAFVSRRNKGAKKAEDISEKDETVSEDI